MPRRLTPLILAAVLLCMAAPAAMAQRTVPQNFFGAVFDGPSATSPPEQQDRHTSLMAQTGVESVRVTFPWTALEPRREKFDFDRTDRTMRSTAKHRIEVVPVILYTPYWARVNRRNPYSPPRRNADFTLLLRKLIQRYGTNGSFWRANPELPRKPIRYWQIWNEPNNPIERYWDGPRGTRYAWPQGYAAILRESHKTIHRYDRGARTVLGGITGVAWRDLRRLYRNRVRNHFDVATLQIYPETVSREVKALKLMRKELVRAKDKDVRLWVTEVAYPAAKGRAPGIGNQRQETKAGMARRVAELYPRLARGRRPLGLERVYWYTWASRYGPHRSVFDHAGLLASPNGFIMDRQPALTAYRRAAQRAQGCVKTAFGLCER